MNTAYLVISGSFMIVLGVIWSKDSFINFVLKLALLGFGAWGLFLALQSAGYIVKA